MICYDKHILLYSHQKQFRKKERINEFASERFDQLTICILCGQALMKYMLQDRQMLPRLQSKALFYKLWQATNSELDLDWSLRLYCSSGVLKQKQSQWSPRLMHESRNADPQSSIATLKIPRWTPRYCGLSHSAFSLYGQKKCLSSPRQGTMMTTPLCLPETICNSPVEVSQSPFLKIRWIR